MRPLCSDCLSEDVAVKVIGPYGAENWFCARDWADWQEFSEKFSKMLGDAVDALKASP